jgi:cyanophycin synthetase
MNKPCLGCGPNYINHRLHWTTSVIEFTIDPILGWTNTLWRVVVIPVKKVFRIDHAHLFLVKTAVRLGIGKFLVNYEDDTDSRARCLWEEAEKRGITMRKFYFWGRKGGGDGPYLAEVKGTTLKFNILPRLTESGAIDWMDDKAMMRKKFQSVGIPLARGGVVFTQKQALRLFYKIGGRVIVKPRTGSRSRHTTISISNEKELLRAFQSAKELSPWVIIEEELRGFVFRVTLIDGKVGAIIRREPPHVIGDGIKTIAELIKEENQYPGRQEGHFCPIEITEETVIELAKQHIPLESIPAQGQFVALGQKVGRSSGGSNTDVTDQVHPENTLLFEKIARFLNDPLVGVDFMVEDISRPWYEQKPSGVIECNSLPFIDLHHYPLRGKVQNVAGKVWDYVERHL